MPCPCCGCETNADCGCETGGYTYYSGLEALFPGLGCCQDGSFFDPDIGGCWEGEAGTESAAEPNLCCCGGVCGTCPSICVYTTIDDCENVVWNWGADISEAECADLADGIWYLGTETITIPSYTYDSSLLCDDPQTQPSEDIDPCTGVAPLSVKPQAVPDPGPGTELTKIIAWIGLTPAPGCQCKKRARYMDKMGCDWCEQNMSQIVGWLQEEHTRTKSLLPFVSFAAEKLVRLAIRRARQGNSQ
jgi:hypothetical protein